MKKHAYFSLLAFEWKCFEKKRRLQGLIYFLFILSIIASMIQPIIFKDFIDNIQNHSFSNTYLIRFFAFSFIIKLAEWLLFTPAYYLQRKYSFQIYQNHIESTYFTLCKENQISRKTNTHSGSELNRIKRTCDGCKDYFNDQFHYTEIVFKLCLSISAIVYFIPLLGCLSLLLGLLALYLTMYLDDKYSISQSSFLEKEHTFFSFFTDIIRNLSTIISLNTCFSVNTVLQKKIAPMRKYFFKSSSISAIKLACVDFVIILITLVLIIGFILQNSDKEPETYLGSLIALLSYISIYTGLFKEFTWLNTLATDTYVNLCSFASYYCTCTPTTKSRDIVWEKIHVSNIKLIETEIQRKVPILENSNIEFDIRKGEHILLIGNSGSGKSTILQLLNGMIKSSKKTFFLLMIKLYPKRRLRVLQLFFNKMPICLMHQSSLI